MVNGGYGGQFATIEDVCTGTQSTTNIYVSAQDYFDNYLNGNPTTFFSDTDLNYRLALTKLWDTARDWIWETDGVGIGTRINTDCTPFQNQNNFYTGLDRCGTWDTYIVESACSLVIGRYYEVCISFNCMSPPDAPCEIYITGTTSSTQSTLTVENCDRVSCGSTECSDSDSPFIKK